MYAAATLHVKRHFSESEIFKKNRKRLCNEMISIQKLSSLPKFQVLRKASICRAIKPLAVCNHGTF